MSITVIRIGFFELKMCQMCFSKTSAMKKTSCFFYIRIGFFYCVFLKLNKSYNGHRLHLIFLVAVV